ncbi:MAG: alcohol dehydrogenase catalytic domain-containing protein [Actinobacteria bacterium]|nr:alcohol dehydrogenase catalytic domain-containing protein [Actinomycetota bacterium]MBW3651950.1 alcohol dehydrogenase catalytic domain-containing protein [Actinomycetota bacterium]
MRAWVLDESPGRYRFGTVEPPPPANGEVSVRLVASALNHMDLWLTRGLPKPVTPHVPGADGAGVVTAVGEGVEGVAVGDEVVVNPAVSCRRCATCLAGESPLCPSFGILGEHRWGTHAEEVLVPAANVVPRPAALDWPEAAAYGLCFLTAWRMLRRARLRAGEVLLVVGVGGGVSSAGLVLGRAMGAQVFVTSRDEAKRQRALALGAAGAFDSGGEFAVAADVVFENVGAATWASSLRALAPGGRLVTCGGTAGSKVEISLPRLFFKQHEILGSTMGSYAEFEQVTKVVAGGVPVVVDEVVDGLHRLPEALVRLESGQQLGKIVLRH